MPTASPRALAARMRAARRWYVYLILCRGNAIYTGIALDVAARYAQHLAGTGARYTRANPPRRLLAVFACADQAEAGRLEAAIKRLSPAEKRRLAGAVRVVGDGARPEVDAAPGREPADARDAQVAQRKPRRG
jgi:putative endonuclease